MPYLEMELELRTHDLQDPPSSETRQLHESLHKSPLILPLDLVMVSPEYDTKSTVN